MVHASESGQGHLVLRKARFSDAEELHRLEPVVFVSYYAAHRFTSKQFRRYINRNTTIAYVISKNGRLVGYALGIALQGARLGAGRLLSIGVAPAFRRKGFADRLLQAFLSEARRRAIRRMYLEVAAKNRGAIQFFTSSGFKILRRLPALYSRSVGGLRMRLMIQR